jgi:hypothetical protein
MVMGFMKVFVNNFEHLPRVLAALDKSSGRSGMTDDTKICESTVVAQNAIVSALGLHCSSLCDALYRGKHRLSGKMAKRLSQLNSAVSFIRYGSEISLEALLCDLKVELQGDGEQHTAVQECGEVAPAGGFDASKHVGLWQSLPLPQWEILHKRFLASSAATVCQTGKSSLVRR